jgi:hypothetical protein
MKGPQARKKDLIVKKLDDELCIYDVERHSAHSLAPMMATLWRRCDGRTSPAELARALAIDEELVALSLERLRDAHLLVDDGAPKKSRGSSRRQWLKQAATLGLGVATIAVPTLAEAASTISDADCARRPPANCGRIPCRDNPGNFCVRPAGNASCSCTNN